MNILAQKKCRVCKKEKSIDDFPNNKSVLSGKDARCKRCNSEAVIKWQKENKEKVNNKNKQWAHAHKDKEKSNANARKRYADNIERERQKGRERRERNSDARRLSVKKWQDAHPEQRLINQHNREAKRREVGGTITIAQWRQLKEKYESKCLRCGKSGLKLALDHVIPLSKGGRNVIENAQPLCGPCNSIKATKTIDYRPKDNQ